MNQEKIEAIQRVQDYIENHLNDRISLYMLAEAANYSVGHTSRMFKEIVGKNAFDYIRERRLSAATEELSGHNKRVIDVAFEFVFDSHEGFTRAFSKQFGMTPKEFQKKKPQVDLFIPKRVSDYYLSQLKGEREMEKKDARIIFVQVVERPARKLILKRGKTAKHYYEYCEEVGSDVWNILYNIKEGLYELMGLWLPENMRPEGTSTYISGIEVPIDFNGDIPDGYEIVDMEPCKMMIFQGVPYDDDNPGDAMGYVMRAADNYDPNIYGYEWDPKIAPRFQFAPQGYRGYIEGRPVRELNK